MTLTISGMDHLLKLLKNSFLQDFFFFRLPQSISFLKNQVLRIFSGVQFQNWMYHLSEHPFQDSILQDLVKTFRILKFSISYETLFIRIQFSASIKIKHHFLNIHFLELHQDDISNSSGFKIVISDPSL